MNSEYPRKEGGTILFFSFYIHLNNLNHNKYKPPKNNTTMENRHHPTPRLSFPEKVFQIITTLKTSGRVYRRRIHTYQSIQDKYLIEVVKQNQHLGENYLSKLREYITNIFTNINHTASYDAFQYVNDVITWYFKSLAFFYKLTKKEPGMPDYILSEIKDISIAIDSSKE
jgi:hypothetical protein